MGSMIDDNAPYGGPANRANAQLPHVEYERFVKNQIEFGRIDEHLHGIEARSGMQQRR